MPSEVDTNAWSGEGTFTQFVIDRLRDLEGVRFIRVEDAPATRSDADYNFISNEIYVGVARRDGEDVNVRRPRAGAQRHGRRRRAGLRRRGNVAVPPRRADHPAVPN